MATITFELHKSSQEEACSGHGKGFLVPSCSDLGDISIRQRHKEDTKLFNVLELSF